MPGPRRAIALAEELGVENVVRQLQFRGLARIELGDLSGLDDLRAALDLALELGLGIETATSYGNLGETVALFDGVAAGLELDRGGTRVRAPARTDAPRDVVAGVKASVTSTTSGSGTSSCGEAEAVVRWDREQGGTQIEVIALMASAPVHAQRGNVDEAAAAGFDLPPAGA